MTTPAMHESDTPPAALHNSGFGRPPVVYECPGVGVTYCIDVTRLRRDCTQLWIGRKPTPAQVICEVATHIASSLQPSASGTEPAQAQRTVQNVETRALQQIARLAAVLRTLGALEPFRGLVKVSPAGDPARTAHHATLGDAWPWLIPHAQPELLRIAWSICAVSYAAPPLLLWTREPSLTLWRDDRAITLRWFGDVSPSSRSAESTARAQRQHSSAGEPLRSRFRS